MADGTGTRRAAAATPAKKALIVGCGIAGPVLAMYLQRGGIEAVICEARVRPGDEAGAFLNLAPSGVRVLDALGIKEQALAAGTPTTGIAFLDHRGKRLAELSQAMPLIKRGELSRALREAAIGRGIAVELGKRLERIENRPSSVVAHFADGSQAHADLLIGCDGLHSAVRRSIMPDAPEPAYTGVVDSGGFTSAGPELPADGLMRMTFGLDGFFGHQTTPSGEVYWFENYSEPSEPDRRQLDALSDDEWRARLLERHRGDHASIAAIVGSGDGRIGRWPIYDLPSLPAWHRESVCLVGDAAHATSPHGGHGASLALEDAIVLAKCLRDLPDTRAAFAAFERLRRERVERLVAEARRNGARKAPSGAVGRRARDLTLRFFLKTGVKRQERAYSYTVDWDEPVAAPEGTGSPRPPASARSEDDREIHALVGRLFESWARGDADAYAGEFTEDSEYVPFDGTLLRGRAANRHLHGRLFETVLADTRLEGEVESIRYLAPTVAVAQLTGSVVFAWQRRPKRRRLSRQTLVLVRCDGRWRATAFQNTRVRPVPTDGVVMELVGRLFRLRARLGRRAISESRNA